MSGFKGPDNSELLLVDHVSTSSPSVGHVNDTHMFQMEKIEVTHTMQFPVNNSANCTEFTTYECTPMTYTRKEKATPILETRRVGQPGSSECDKRHRRVVLEYQKEG